jgi:hypothetical protein
MVGRRKWNEYFILFRRKPAHRRKLDADYKFGVIRVRGVLGVLRKWNLGRVRYFDDAARLFYIPHPTQQQLGVNERTYTVV